jgi:hypothetical protein
MGAPTTTAVPREGELISGLYSEVARNTEFDINALRQKCKFDDLPPAEQASPSKSKKDGGPKGPVSIQIGLPGELARAIEEKINEKLRAQAEGSSAHSKATEATFKTHSPRLPTSKKPLRSNSTSSFAGPGIYDSPWTSKFTASHSPGALNRLNEQRPDPCWYKVQYGTVLDRYPAWDFSEKPRHVGRSKPTSPRDREAGVSEGLDTFLTSLGLETPSSSRQREKAFSNKKGTSAWALGPPRPELGKVGRVHVLMHEVSEPATDLLQQDIKGQPKLRYPEWDFHKGSGRPPLLNADNIMPPGKYDVSWSSVEGKLKSGVAFEHAWNPRSLNHSASDGQLGHFALMGALQADEKRWAGGVVTDRSKAKDAVRQRITHVNDFERELPRPSLPPASREYHDPKDPVACEITLRHQLTFDASLADVSVTRRRDVAPNYSRMLSRGKDAVQGIRSLQDDVGVRGAVGLGISKSSPPSAPKPGIPTSSPKIQKDSVGGYLIPGSHHVKDAKRLGLQDLQKAVNFKREAKGPGFTKPTSGLKAARQSRSHEAISGWTPEVL